MTNKITIDIYGIYNVPNFSITDTETIRQIALFCMRNPGHNALTDKIDPMFRFAALYPEVMIYDPKVAEDINNSGKEFIDKVKNIRYDKG